MELIVLLLTVSLLSCKAQGSSAVTPVFVKKGEDVLLNITRADGLEQVILFSWKFNEKDILVAFVPNNNPTVFPNYTERIEFSVENYSVKLKNLQKTDSGVYTAHGTRVPKELKVAEYKVTVQDPVSPVDLTVDSVSNSSNSCNVTVTCRTQDSHISSTFRCDTQTCSQEGGEQSKVTASGASLKVYLEPNGSIICNHSNQVSWTENKEIIEQLCPRHSDVKQPLKDVAGTVIAVVVSLLFILIIMIVAAVVYHRKRGKYNRENIENTVYEVPQIAATAQTPVQRPTRDVSELSPTSTYCLVGPHTGTVESTETRDKPLPESLYAQVEKPAKPLKK
ncbi:CD48 antigen-like isoform X1 [Epinephelus fuscoguttatus]|uniref:CD48 antigen-like isoform X1 n=1 Tax=Epinephelus fuscoguttatus TaxID=293821 RepID=UPI0020D1BDD5|nr:CD48 antigen-like isoform X1 [Epinephelus fuscoguttatus]